MFTFEEGKAGKLGPRHVSFGRRLEVLGGRSAAEEFSQNERVVGQAFGNSAFCSAAHNPGAGSTPR